MEVGTFNASRNAGTCQRAGRITQWWSSRQVFAPPWRPPASQTPLSVRTLPKTRPCRGARSGAVRCVPVALDLPHHITGRRSPHDREVRPAVPALISFRLLPRFITALYSFPYTRRSVYLDDRFSAAFPLPRNSSGITNKQSSYCTETALFRGVEGV